MTAGVNVLIGLTVMTASFNSCTLPWVTKRLGWEAGICFPKVFARASVLGPRYWNIVNHHLMCWGDVCRFAEIRGMPHVTLLDKGFPDVRRRVRLSTSEATHWVVQSSKPETSCDEANRVNVSIARLPQQAELFIPQWTRGTSFARKCLLHTCHRWPS